LVSLGQKKVLMKKNMVRTKEVFNRCQAAEKDSRKKKKWGYTNTDMFHPFTMRRVCLFSIKRNHEFWGGRRSPFAKNLKRLKKPT